MLVVFFFIYLDKMVWNIVYLTVIGYKMKIISLSYYPKC